MLKNRLFVVIFTMFCCNLFCLSLSKASSLKSIKNIFGKQQSCLSADSFKAEWDCNGGSFKTKLCAFGENRIISLIYSIIDDLNECTNAKGTCADVSMKITVLKSELGNSLSDNIKSCLGVLETETGIEILNNINNDISNSSIDNYKKDIQDLYKYKYCLEGSKTNETTDDIFYIDDNVKEKEGFLLLLYKQLYYELTAISNLVSDNENETHHEKYEYAKDQILTLVDRILFKENEKGLLDIYAELDEIDATEYTKSLENIKNNGLTDIAKISEFRNTINGQIEKMQKANISDCGDSGVISERDNNLENKYCIDGNNKVRQKYIKIDGLIDELEALKVTSIKDEENENINIYYIENYITIMQNKIKDLKTEIADLKNLVNQYSSDLMMNVGSCFDQYIRIDTIIKNFDKLDFYFNADNNTNSLVKYYRYLKELNAQFGGSALYTKDDVNTAYTEFEKRIKAMLNPQEFFVNFLNYNSSFINLIRSEENKMAEIFKQELFSEEIKAVVYDNAIIETMCYIMDLITGNIGRSIMALSLIITAFIWLQGKIEPKELFSFVLAISIMYGSLSIANLIAKNNYSCGFAKSLEYIERTGSVDKCEDGFIWSMSANKCVAKSCYNPTMKNVIFYSDYAFYKGNSVLGECTNGYEGKINAKCIFADDELSWEYTGGCEKIYCYIQPSYEGVGFNTKDNEGHEITTFDYQTKVSGKCKTGYKGKGYTATCTEKNKWSYSGDCKPIYCPALSRAADGTTKQASWPATKANSVGYGTCFSPYVNTYFADFDLNPNSSRSVSFAFCDENGKWDFQSGNNPTLLKNIYSAKTKAERDTKKKEFQSANNNSKYSKYLCEISRCEAVNIADTKTGNAIWPESDIGDENIIGICGSGYYYNNGTEKTINSVETYDLKNQYLTKDEQNEIDEHFNKDLKDILAGLSDEIKKKYNLNETKDLTDEIIRTLKIEEITAKMQNKDKDAILGKCEANGEIVTNNNMICYKRKCPAITVGDKNSNYATWPETDALTVKYNESSESSYSKTGCIKDYGGSHSAYCDEFGTWHFDSYNNGYKTIKLEPCVLNACDENITLSLKDNNGFTIIGSWNDKIKWNIRKKIKSDYNLESVDAINDLTDIQKNEILGSLKIEYLKNKDLTAIVASLTDEKIAKIKSDYGSKEIKDLSYVEKNRIIENLKIGDFKDKDLTAVIVSLLDEEGTTVMSVNESERMQNQIVKVYCDDNSSVYKYAQGNDTFSEDANGVSYIGAICSDKNEWKTNGKCTYKACKTIKEEDANLETGWAYFKSVSYPELDNGWGGYCHSYFANDKKTFNSLLEKVNKLLEKNSLDELENIEDLEGRVLSFSDIVESLKDGQIVSGDDASCKFDKNKDKSVLSIAKNQCKIPVIFADLYKAEGVLKFFDVGEEITCSKENFNFKADVDNNSFVCIMFTSLEDRYSYSIKRINKSYKILAVEGETIVPGTISNITEFKDQIFDKTEKCHPVTAEIDIDKDTTHFSFENNAEQYIYKNNSYTDAGVIKNDKERATYPNACAYGYVGNPVVECGDNGIWEPTENKCKPGCYISAIVSDITDGNFQNDFNKIDITNLFIDINENGEFKTKLDFVKEPFVYAGTYLKIPVNGCENGYAGIPIIKCEDSKWIWKADNKTNNYCHKGGCYFSTYANAEGTSGWKILNSLNDFSNTRSNAIVKNNEYMIADCNNGMVSNMDNNFTNSTINSTEQQKHIITQCQNGIIKPYSNSGTSCVSGCVYGDKSNGWNDNMFRGTETNNAYYIFKEIGGTAGIFSVRGATNSVIQRNCKANYSAAQIEIDGYSCNSSLSTQPVVQCENGMWKQYINGGKHCYTCGIVVQYYSPRDETLFKEKKLNEGDTVVCNSDSFGGDPDPNVKKLCRIKGSDKYFGYEGDGETYTVNDALFTKQSSACHIAYANRDLSTSLLIKDYTKNGETELYDGTAVYSIGNNYGLRKNGEKYIINCASEYAGAPEIVCDNGKWSWKPTENTDNYCYLMGCDPSKETDGRNLADTGWGLETTDCATSDCVSSRNTARKIIPEGSWASAECAYGYISNADNPIINNDKLIERQKSIFGRCVNGRFEQTVDNVKYGDTCVRGCVYGDTSMGWTSEMMKNTTGNYAQYNTKKWGTASVGRYTVRLTNGDSAIIYKNCNTGYVPGGTGTTGLSYPLVQCNYDTGKWSKYETYYMGCEILSGCTEFAFHITEHTFTVPSAGLSNVKMQVWGAQGGLNSGNSAAGGKGGYGYGSLSSIAGNTKITVSVGEWGGNRQVGEKTYGAGKGGAITGGCGSSKGKGGNGGGGTKIWFDNKILQAGGGGGAGEATGHNGGDGGGAGKDGEIGAGNAPGKPGTLNGDGTANVEWANGGSNGNGGDTKSSSSKGVWCGGAGGGGYAGGASGEYGKDYYGAGGGGSGYVSGFSNVVAANGVKEKNGFARICWGNDTNCDGGSTAPTKSVCGTQYSNKFSNAVEIHYGAGTSWEPGFFRYGYNGTCANNKGENFEGNWGDPIYGDEKICMSPGGFCKYADEDGTFTAL